MYIYIYIKKELYSKKNTIIFYWYIHDLSMFNHLMNLFGEYLCFDMNFPNSVCKLIHTGSIKLGTTSPRLQFILSTIHFSTKS